MGVAFRTLDNLERRIDELERLVRHLYERTGVEVPPIPPRPPASDEVMTLIAAGNKIGAIEQLRRETGLGLAEAKQAVEEIESGPR